MDGQKSVEMGMSGPENLVLDDEVFQELSPIIFRYPETNNINFDLDATYLLDNPLETTINYSTDVQPDQTVVHDGGISAVQIGEFGLSDQEHAIMNSSPIPDQGMTGMSFTNFLTQETNPLTVLGQDMSELGSSNLPTQVTYVNTSVEMGRSGSENLVLDDEVFLELSPIEFRYPETNNINFDLDATYLLDNPLETTINSSTDVQPDQTVVHDGGISAVQIGEFGLSDQERAILNSSPIQDQGMTGMSFTNFLTQETNPLTVLGQDMSELGSSNIPTQVTYVNTLQLHNQGSSSRDTFGIPTQESFTNIGFLSHEQNMNTSWFPYQPQPVFKPMENNLGTTEVITISSSDDEQFQEGFNPNNDNDNGARGSNSNLPLRQTLSKEMISQHFHMPIIDAATTLNIGVTVLKIRCRELGFSRWPQRKLTSIQAIITYLQEFGESSGIIIEGNVQERIIRLENERRRIEDTPDLELEDDTKRLRQAIYKSSHKKRKRSDRDH